MCAVLHEKSRLLLIVGSLPYAGKHIASYTVDRHSGLLVYRKTSDMSDTSDERVSHLFTHQKAWLAISSQPHDIQSNGYDWCYF